MRKLIIGESEWGIKDENAPAVMKQVREAMENGTSAELQLVDSGGRSVIVFLNTKVTPVVVVDTGDDPKPSEMS